MSVMTTFDYGVAAMMAHSEAMGAIGQNIANMRTPGYKRADVQFASLIANPLPDEQVAGSVVTKTRRLIDAQGSFERTGRPLDIALDGPGMLIYSTSPQPGGELLYSRNGSLSTMPVGVAAQGGPFLSAYDDLYLMAWPIGADGKVTGTDAGSLEAIPYSLRDGFDGRQTSTASLVATVPATGGPTTSFEIFRYDGSGNQSRLLSDWNRNVSTVTLAGNLDSSTAAQVAPIDFAAMTPASFSLADADTIAATGFDHDFTRRIKVTDTLGANHDVTFNVMKIGTAGDWAFALSSPDAAGIVGTTNNLLGWGTLSFAGDGKLSGLQFSNSAAAPADIPANAAGDLATSLPVDWLNGAAASPVDIVFGSQNEAVGLAQSATDFSVRTLNTWTASFRDLAGAAIGSPTTVIFDGAGNLVSPATGALDVGGLFSLDVSDVKQLGVASYKGEYRQDGLGSGDFLNWQIDEGGVVSGVFESGAVTPLYRLPIALFANANGLAEQSRGLFAQSTASGAPAFEMAGKTARVVSETRELSNVSLEDEFSQMIVTQRAYASAAQLIQTADEMTKTARDLR
jgi:flagellar hook protein FlgE